MDWSCLSEEDRHRWHMGYTLPQMRRKRRLKFLVKMLKPKYYTFPKFHPDECFTYLYEPGGLMVDGIDIYVAFLKKYRGIKLKKKDHHRVIEILAEEFKPKKLEEPSIRERYGHDTLSCYTDGKGNYYESDFVYNDIMKWLLLEEREKWKNYLSKCTSSS